MLVENVMTHNPICVSSGDTVAAASALMRSQGIRHLLVADHGALLGILSIKDIPQFIKPQLFVFDIMTPNPIAVQATVTTDNARRLMQSHGVASLPVLRGSRLVGIVTVSDLS